MLPVLPAVVLLALGLAPAARGVRRSWWRTAGLLAAAVLLGACGLVPGGRDRAGWQGALAIGLVSAVVPLGVALADPVRGWRAAFGRPRLTGRVAQVLMFPVVAGVIASVALTVLYTSGTVDRAAGGDGTWTVVLGVALVVGTLVTLPLLTDELLPSWCTPAVKAGLAALDGVVDAVPGIVVMTTRDWVTGQTLLAVAEAVAVPFMLWVAVDWARHDSAQARRIDAELDAREESGEDAGVPWWERGA